MSNHLAARYRCRFVVWGLLLIILPLGGCEIDTFFDQSKPGRWERTPVTLPILERLDVIDEPSSTTMQITSVRREDLVPDKRAYVIGSGDLITISAFDLLVIGQQTVVTRRVDETGKVRIPEIGAVQASDQTAAELEAAIAREMDEQGIVREAEAEVSVTLQEARQNTFSILGAPEHGSTAFGTYAIPRPDFRLSDAMAMAGGVRGDTDKLLIIRRTPLTDEVAGRISRTQEAGEDSEPVEPAEDPAQQIEEMMQEPDGDGDAAPQDTTDQQQAPEPPSGVESGLDERGGQWVRVGDQWVQVERGEEGDGAAGQADGMPGADGAAAQSDEEGLGGLMTQRIIEVPYDKLRKGDMRYDIVIRPGDIIRVPAPSVGFVYVMGEISRPGTYTLRGENEMTIKQVVAAAGNPTQLAVLERVDLVRRVGDSTETTIRLNVKAIFEGKQPDIFLKPNDLLNFGTNWPATPMAILRNGFRATYGFGFVLDRNFEQDVFDD